MGLDAFAIESGLFLVEVLAGSSDAIHVVNNQDCLRNYLTLLLRYLFRLAGIKGSST
jgi:hypothetical protein